MRERTLSGKPRLFTAWLPIRSAWLSAAPAACSGAIWHPHQGRGIYPASMWLTKGTPGDFKALFNAKAEAA